MGIVTELYGVRQESDLDVLPDDRESLISIGQAAREGMDGWRWLLGDVARKVAIRYGEDDLGDFAGQINVIPRTLRAYRQVAEFYPSGTRGQYDNLTWSHYRDAARLGDLDAALALLDRASADNWTWRDLTDALNVALGRPPLRRPLLDAEARIDSHTPTGQVTFDIAPGADLSALVRGQTVRLVVSEVRA